MCRLIYKINQYNNFNNFSEVWFKGNKFVEQNICFWYEYLYFVIVYNFF